WNTDKAAGYDSRDKYHLYIGECSWEDGHAFLFINKADYGGDPPLHKKKYEFFPLPINYFGFGKIIFYTDRELQEATPELKGCLTKDHMQQLFNAVAGCKKMVTREALLVGNALKVAF